MNRQVRLVALATATLAAGTGLASGQAPSSTVPAGSTANAGPVYVMKTAGQPERRVQVVKSEAQPDGSILTDVKDLASGTIYTLTNPSFLGKSASAPVAAPATAPAPAPTTVATRPASPTFDSKTPRPLFGQFPNQRMADAMQSRERLVPVEQIQANGLPQARDRKADPLLAGVTAPAAIAARTPFPSFANIPQEPPSVLGKVFGDPMKHQPTPRVGTVPPAPPLVVPAPRPALHPGVTVVMPTVGPAAVPRVPKADDVKVAALPPVPAPTVTNAAVVSAPAPGLAIPAIDANAKPSAATGLFDSQAAAPSVALPTIVESNPMPAIAKAVPAVAVAVEPPAPAPIVPPVKAIAIDVPAPVLPTVEIPVPAVAIASNNSTELPKDIRVMIDDVKTHKRPSFRMENATALSESSFAKHPSAIEALVSAATTDKAGVVRGHCIAILADLGYADAAFLKSLDTWSNDLEPAVQRAAVAAKAKLAGR